MLVENQKIKTKIGGKTIKHYKSLGYDIKIFEEIIIPVEHLPITSHEKVKVKCDRCDKTFDREYRIYLDLHKRRNGDFCWDCANEVIQPQVIYERYGVKNPGQSEAVKEKMKKTCLERYGVPYSGQIPEVKINRKKTILKKYGVEYGFLLPEAREKCKKVTNEKWGADYPFLSDKFWAYFCEKQYTKGSNQQLELFNKLNSNGYNPKNNVLVGRCILDIVVELNSIKIDIEYDGWYWHQDQQKDRRRDEFLKLKGYRILRIKGGHKLPDDAEFFDAINDLAHGEYRYKEIVLSDWKEGESA